MLQTIKQLHSIAVRNFVSPVLSTMGQGGLRLDLCSGTHKVCAGSAPEFVTFSCIPWVFAAKDAVFYTSEMVEIGSIVDWRPFMFPTALPADITDAYNILSHY
jgi:hypothetical protein